MKGRSLYVRVAEATAEVPTDAALVVNDDAESLLIFRPGLLGAEVIELLDTLLAVCDVVR